MVREALWELLQFFVVKVWDFQLRFGWLECWLVLWFLGEDLKLLEEGTQGVYNILRVYLLKYFSFLQGV